MLDDMHEVEESELPPLTDSRVQDYGVELGLEFESFSKPRFTLETEIWPASIRAYMSIRDDMPFLPSMKFIDNGMLGNNTVRTAVKQQRDALICATLPTDESWLEPVQMNDQDDDGTLEKVKRLLIAKFQEADVRTSAVMVYDQLLSLGTTAVGIRWDQLYAVRRAPRELVTGLKAISQELNLADASGDLLHTKRGPVKYAKKIFDGPIIYPISMYRLYLDPTADPGGKDRDTSFIYMMTKTMTDLKGAKDKNGKPLYDHEVLEGVTEWTYQQYYSAHPYEAEGIKLMGINPSLENLGKFVPVYVFYRQVRTFKDGEDVFVDKFFYVARSGNAKEWKIIRVQDNPSTYGCRPFFTMACDPFPGTPYGSSLVEKVLSEWKAANIIDGVSLNMKVLQAAPPSFFVGGVLKDDRKPRMMPGGFQEIVMRPGVGMDWIKPFPNVNPENVLIGMQEQRYYSERIVAGLGAASAAMTNDPTRSVSKGKTATQVRQDASEGSESEQVLVDRSNDTLWEPIANTMHELCRQHYTEDQRFITADETGKPMAETITPEELNRDRAIKIVGRKALADKANMVTNMLEALKILANPQAAQVIQNLPLILQDVIFKAVTRLGVAIKPEYRMTPEEIFAKEPAVMMAAIQNALQDPQMRQQIAQALLQSPEGQQFLAQIKQQFSGEQQEGEQPQPGGNEAA